MTDFNIQQRIALRERFRKVIIGEHYGPIAVEGILSKYFEEYMLDIPEFEKMLSEYEDRQKSVGV